MADLNHSDLAKWSKAVRESDNYKCVLCGGTYNGTFETRLEAHHIKDKHRYPHLAYDLTNGITLCNTCHRGITIYSKDKIHPKIQKIIDETLFITVPKGLKTVIEAHAEAHGQSVNGLVNALLRADMGYSDAQWKAQPQEMQEEQKE